MPDVKEKRLNVSRLREALYFIIDSEVWSLS